MISSSAGSSPGAARATAAIARSTFGLRTRSDRIAPRCQRRGARCGISPAPMRVDLRSDTVTLPTRAMLDAMTHAPLGDDVLGDDPTVRTLEERCADLSGKEAALFVPSGTMANLIGILVSTRPGDEVLLHADAHPFHYEGAGAAVVGGVQLRT